ncbi:MULTISPECIES: cytochrome C oxidase subunit IV family protein [unclassified Haladaptatus]|uniref:cytochrome C oxidase subunit IV family protein n=1 Tax=unclassified Haladaptatus TaxID=2622732 RepID=UPI0023E8DE9C|nr:MULTISPECIES: cytochrome C oxidase subunit IV family protein [unclassified Haladaptatus]
MTSTKLYAAIYVVLFVMATAQVLIEFAGLAYWTAFAVIIVLSFVKALFVAGYYQHLLTEPRAVTVVVLIGLLAALALTLAASYSIT